MATQGLQANVITFSATISAYEKGRQWEAALDTLFKLVVARRHIDAITFNATISACEKGNMVTKAVALLATMKRMHYVPDVISYNSVISACDCYSTMMISVLGFSPCK